MPVYRNNRLVHIHVPKTAGTAIEEHFHEIGDMEWGRESWLGEEHKRGRWYEYQHLTWVELQALSNGEFEAWEAFAVVRDPYARLVSDYLWRMSVGAPDPDSAIRVFDSFGSLVGAIPLDVDAGWHGHIRGADRMQANFLIHVRPQHHYAFGEDGSCLLDEVISFENIATELGLLFGDMA